MSRTQSEKAKERWKRGEGSGFKKGNRLWDNLMGKKTQFKKGRKPWITGKKAPWAKNLSQLFKKGHTPWNKGIRNRKEYKYSINWTRTLRRAIRERDNYTCCLCLKQQEDMVFDVHHIDYDKYNCNPDNLITLCRSCHSITNYNREKWKTYFLLIR